MFTNQASRFVSMPVSSSRLCMVHHEAAKSPISASKVAQELEFTRKTCAIVILYVSYL